MTVLYAIELFGVAVFAMAGALEAARNRLDLFGVLVLAFVSALGGGTLRDLLLNVSPLAWIGDVTLAYTAFGGGLLMFFMARYFAVPFKVLLYADAIGLAAFTVSGTQAALALELPGLIVVMMGMASGIFGGILRDIMANEVPLIFRRDIYATASFCGALLVWLGHQVWPDSSWLWLAGFILVLAVRSAAIHWRLSLPGFLSTVAYRKDNHPRDL
ncbi:trimeric intracellular cation channel family protein [Saccharospirillum impatiens]|uniref:trimeric intracellular cation channel family protein n=1 Tax=Saccharospirillum impatiens TaxID=169438 RepID=UPI0003FAB7D0|nr:trimeric intracellular cation channel family protein [Saccharospirillum impatiens]